MKLKIAILSLFGWAVGLSMTACSESLGEADVPVSESQPAGLVLRVGEGDMARTALGDEAEDAHQIRWAVGDQIAVWAKESAAAEFTLEATPFTFATYNAEWHSADFLADAPAMAEGTYRYHALYPIPAERNGMQVTYTLPAVQSGQYDPALDVMTATTTGNALLPRSGSQTSVAWEEPEMRFSHLFHLIRIRIPEGKNLLGLSIKRLQITFPQEVVGTVSFDVADPAATAVWSNLSNEITVEVPDGTQFDAGQGYLWLHVKPTVLQGEISFRAFNEVGVVSDPISTTVDRTLEPQHITPIALTIPASPLAPFTYIDIRETANHLGEDWQTMTVSGYQFLVPFSEETTSSVVFNRDVTNSYKVAVCADPAAMAGKSLPIRYESEHTLFDDPVVLPNALSATSYTQVEKVVPYLLEEDFSGAPASASNDSYTNDSSNNTSTTGVALGGSLSGWNASRYQVFADQYVRIGVRYQCGAYIVGRYCGRLDTPALTKLKSGANASVKVVFDMGCYIPNKAYVKTKVIGGVTTWDDSDNKVAYCLAGTHTSSSNPIAGQTQGDVAEQVSNAVSFARMCDETGDTGSMPHNAFPHKEMSFVATGSDNTTRISWWALTDREDSAIGKNCHYYIYLDNIKVSIDNSAE